MRTLLLHNPQAGAGGHTEKELMAALKLGGLKADYCSTKADDFPGALSQKADQYVVAGGDGTIAKVVTRLPDRRRPVALMPLGTANNVARSFAVAGTPQELAERYDPNGLRRLDIGVAKGPWGEERFIEAVGLGTLALAMASKASTDKPSGSRKIIRGRRSLLRTLTQQIPVEVDLEIDGTSYRDRYLAIEIMNTASSGPALPLAPDADPGDGWLDVVLIREEDRDPFRAWIEAPQECRPDFGRIVRARSVSFTWTGEPLRVDDELPDAPPEPGRVHVGIEPIPVLIMGLSQAARQTRDEHATEAAA